MSVLDRIAKWLPRNSTQGTPHPHLKLPRYLISAVQLEPPYQIRVPTLVQEAAIEIIQGVTVAKMLYEARGKPPSSRAEQEIAQEIIGRLGPLLVPSGMDVSHTQLLYKHLYRSIGGRD